MHLHVHACLHVHTHIRTYTLQLNASLSPVGKRLAQFGILHTCAGACTATYARHYLSVTGNTY